MIITYIAVHFGTDYLLHVRATRRLLNPLQVWFS